MGSFFLQSLHFDCFPFYKNVVDYRKWEGVAFVKECVIFCAAGFDGLAVPLTDEDYIIAADGGLKHTESLGLRPHAIIGDFDSLHYIPMGAEVFPVEKDDTDSMLAVKLGLSKGCGRFLIYGGLDGVRLDHTVANYQALQYLADRGAQGVLIGKDFCATVIQNGALSFPGGKRGDISVFCMGPDAQGVNIEGLYYPLKNGTLTSGFPLGVSNHFTDSAARISVAQGSLLILWRRAAGLPEFEA